MWYYWPQLTRRRRRITTMIFITALFPTLTVQFPLTVCYPGTSWKPTWAAVVWLNGGPRTVQWMDWIGLDQVGLCDQFSYLWRQITVNNAISVFLSPLLPNGRWLTKRHHCTGLRNWKVVVQVTRWLSKRLTVEWISIRFVGSVVGVDKIKIFRPRNCTSGQ